MALVTPEIVKQVARLARLKLEGAELDRMASQLDGILRYVQQLQAVSTDGIEPTSHVIPLVNVLREDTPQPSLSPEVVAAMAPARQQRFVKVPKVIES